MYKIHIPFVVFPSSRASKDAFEYVKKYLNRIRLQIILIYLLKVINYGRKFSRSAFLGLDFMAIALAELGSISERRTYQLISGL
jgi:histidine ammonia-lyase